jgi:hypothetical protein
MRNLKIMLLITGLLIVAVSACFAETITFQPYDKEEEPYIINGGTHDLAKMIADFGAGFNGDHFRFADTNAFWIYKFEFDRTVNAVAKIDISAEYKVSIAMSDAGQADDYIVVLEEKAHVHDRVNRAVKTIKYSDFIKSPGKKVWIKFEDSILADGWGVYLDDFTLEYTLGVSVEPAGKLATTWSKIKGE